MKELLLNLLNNHPIGLSIFFATIVFGYFWYIFKWAQEKNTLTTQDYRQEECVNVTPDHYSYITTKQYTPRDFLIKLIILAEDKNIGFGLNEEENFVIYPGSSKTDFDSLLFKRHKEQHFGPYLINRTLKKAVKAHKKAIMGRYKKAFTFQLIPFIGGLILSIPPLIPVIYHEIIWWAPLAAVLAYCNYLAYQKLWLYTPEGKKYAACVNQALKEFKLASPTKEQLTKLLPISLAFYREKDLSHHFRSVAHSSPRAHDRTYTALWLAEGYHEPSIGKRLIKSFGKQYKTILDCW